MAAIAERPTRTRAPRLALASPELGLPPGSVPIDPVRTAIRSYRAGVITADRLVAIVDRHADALEREIARKAAQHLADYKRMLDRAEVLAGYVSSRLAQLEWLKRFPAGPARDAVPLGVPVGTGRGVEVPRLLAALRMVELPQRAVDFDPRVRRLDGRRGAAASMAALADAGVSVTDIALELGTDRRRAWSMLNGHVRAPPDLQEALERLVGVDEAAVVIAGIPKHPRQRAAPSPAVEALHSAGATAADVAALIPVGPASVRGWLRGALRPSPENAAALAGALEQLLGAEAAADLLALIPREVPYRKGRAKRTDVATSRIAG